VKYPSTGIKAPKSLRIPQPRGGVVARSALTLAVALAGSTGALAQQADEEEVTLETIKVKDRTIDTNPYAQEGAPYKARVSGDARNTRPLAETPRNISVLTRTQIEDSGFTDLRQILDAQPGITLGTGENGNAFGDRYIIRGQEARSDVFVDGLRDPGMTIRESFATEQVEISKGPSSSFAGRGTAGGAINSITKQASSQYDFNRVSAAGGTDSHTRLTLDSNQAITDTIALRANLLYSYEEVPDRDPADRERQGVALSALFTPTEALEILVDYYGLDAEDKPDLGGYLLNRKPARNVPVYAQRQDFLESDVDTFTARISYDFTPDVYLHNATRYGTTDNGYVATGARGASTGVNNPGGVHATTTLSTHQGWQEVDYLVNQTNLFANLDLGGRTHEFILGMELSDHEVAERDLQRRELGPELHHRHRHGAERLVHQGRLGPGRGRHRPPHEPPISTGPWDQDWQARTVSTYLMDTVDLSKDVTLFAGLRYDDTEIDLRTQNAQQQAITGDYNSSDGKWNGHAGITWEFRPDANVYLSYATAADLNGGESDVGTSGGYGGLVTYNGQAAGAEPESTENIELGTKWNLFDGQLLLTAALFQITKTDVMEGADYGSAGTFNTGENEVWGFEFGASGNITDKLSAQAGFTTMDAEVTESFNPANEGRTLSNFADDTAFAQLRYRLSDKLAIGGALKYESKKYAGQPDSAAAFNPTTGQYSQPVPSYTVYDLFATWEFTETLDARLNVGNVTDEEYYLAAYRSGSFLYYGDARNVRLTVNYVF
jgi:catecholate siderophore receptor